MVEIETVIPWIEKYKPDKIDDMVIDPIILNKFKKIIEDLDMPNCIITGIPGIGKTSTILCLADILYGEYKNQAVLELNASADRGIKAVQDSIIHFCKKKLVVKKGCNYSKHKLVLLDEADNMTPKAQQLINNLMEKYIKTTRFAFTCNNSCDIIEAIQSRCVIFRYKRLNNEQITDKLKEICNLENINYDNKGLETITFISQGDLRQAINNLQLTYNSYGKINKKTVYNLCDEPQPFIIKNILISCYNKEIRESLSQVRILFNKGYSPSDIILSLLNVLKLVDISEIDESMKIKFMKEVAETCIVISRGVDSQLQITGCIARMISLV